MLAILMCAGDPSDKADAFFMLLNPPGQNQDSISANDKDWPEILDTLVYIATFWMQEQEKDWSLRNLGMARAGVFDEKTTKRAAKALRECEDESKPELIGFITLLFGYESRLSR